MLLQLFWLLNHKEELELCENAEKDSLNNSGEGAAAGTAT